MYDFCHEHTNGATNIGNILILCVGYDFVLSLGMGTLLQCSLVVAPMKLTQKKWVKSNSFKEDF